MAGHNAATEIRKREGRLETFLKCNMSVDSYERVRSYESCIVCSEKESRAFKFVVLDDYWIYLTENPPKKLIKVIYLQDVMSVNLESDFPDFLSGAEKENTQHVTVKYLTDEKPKSEKRTEKSDAKKDSDDLKDEDKQLIHSGTYRGDELDSTTAKARSTLSSRSGTERGGRLKVKEANALSVTARWGTCNPAGSAQNSMRKVTFRDDSSSLLHVTGSARDGNGYPSTIEEQPDEKKLVSKSVLKQKGGRPRTSSVSVTETVNKRLGNSLDAEVLRDALDVTYHQKTSNMQLTLNHLEDDDQSTSKADVVPPLDLTSVIDTPRSILRSSLSTTRSQQDRGNLYSASLHLYILNKASKLMTLIRCAWQSSLLKCTMDCDAGVSLRREMYPPAKLASEKLEIRFNQLRSDILCPTNTLEDTFGYIQELQNGTERNFVLKRFFWKCSQLFPFLVDQLSAYIPLPKKETDDFSRADQTELILLTVETLTQMLRESEIFSSRMLILKSNGARSLEQLFKVLVSQPQGLEPLQERCQVYLDEFTEKGALLMYELILVAEQTAWCDVSGTFYKVSWIIDALEKMDSTELGDFVDRLVQRALYLISFVGSTRMLSVSSRELTPDQAVLAYALFYVLNTLTLFSDQILTMIQEKYFEEFKYFVQLPSAKIPSCYPISEETHNLIKIFVRRIIGHDFIVGSQRGTGQIDNSAGEPAQEIP